MARAQCVRRATTATCTTCIASNARLAQTTAARWLQTTPTFRRAWCCLDTTSRARQTTTHRCPAPQTSTAAAAAPSAPLPRLAVWWTALPEPSPPLAPTPARTARCACRANTALLVARADCARPAPRTAGHLRRTTRASRRACCQQVTTSLALPTTTRQWTALPAHTAPVACRSELQAERLCAPPGLRRSPALARPLAAPCARGAPTASLAARA